MYEPHFVRLRVVGAAVHARARGSADHHGHCRPPAIVHFRRHVHDLVKPAGDEIHKLHFHHRAHTHQRRANARAHHGGLADGRVDHPVFAELLQHARGDFEGAAIDANVLAHDENGRVALHLFPKALADGFQISE